MADGSSIVKEPEPAPMSPVSKNGCQYPEVSAPTMAPDAPVMHDVASRETTLLPLIAREATAVGTGRQVRVRSARTNRTLTNVKEAVLFKRQIVYFLMCLLASVLSLTYHGSTSIIPEPIEAIFFTMKYLQKYMFVSHMDDNEAYLLRFLADHVIGIMMLGFGLFIAWLGVQATRNSKCSLELFKAIMTVWFMVSLLSLVFTLYSWTLMPVFQELLPRCDAWSVCMPYGPQTLPSVTQACIQHVPEQRPSLPGECAWTQKYFLQSCHPATPEFTLPDADFFPNGFVENELASVVFLNRRQLAAGSPTDIECTIDYALMQGYHQFIDHFGLYLARATMVFWSIVLTLILNVVSSTSCVYMACKFEDVQQNSRRRIVRDIQLHSQIPENGRTITAERRTPLLSEDGSLHV
eukprot:GEMP01032583.1.p1 GENE.GEMP01032583.1~~GEMP01032583.1.p1  ORF type:complete len:408 (+),score=85.84 GEMP01032583.1:134-1357(+)